MYCFFVFIYTKSLSQFNITPKFNLIGYAAKYECKLFGYNEPHD